MPWAATFRIAAFAVALGMLACDSMHSVAIRVPPPYGGVAHAESSSRIVWAAQAVLRRHGFSQQDAGPLEEVWAWRDPRNPPGLRVRITTSTEGVELRLSQDLLGPKERIPKYTAVFNDLVKTVGACVGPANVLRE